MIELLSNRVEIVCIGLFNVYIIERVEILILTAWEDVFTRHTIFYHIYQKSVLKILPILPEWVFLGAKPLAWERSSWQWFSWGYYHEVITMLRCHGNGCHIYVVMFKVIMIIVAMYLLSYSYCHVVIIVQLLLCI